MSDDFATKFTQLIASQKEGGVAVPLLLENAGRAGKFLKSISNPSRLMILCILSEGEKTVTELEQMLRLRQPTLSQQLARLREEELVTNRREGKSVYYRLANNDALKIVDLVHDHFCGADQEPATPRKPDA